MTTTDEAVPAPAPPRDPAEGRSFPCESCGADLVFHIGVQRLKCSHCGFVREIRTEPDAAIEEQDFAAMIARLSELRDGGRNDEQGFQEVAP